MKNKDRIRNMSDEELHKFLIDFEEGEIDYSKTFCDMCYKDAALKRENTDCNGCLNWWLNKDSREAQGIDFFENNNRNEKWIRAKDMEPQKNGHYITIVHRVAPEELGGNEKRIKILRWNNGDWKYPIHFPISINEVVTEKVTHWMKLPKFPDGEDYEG